ncbi:translocation/assembly module TamB [Vibrio fluvialis]|nr:translocation/assembly module TamB [Vibrio fluvialis]
MIRRAIKWTKWFTAALVALTIILTLAIAGLLFTNQGLNLVVWGAQKALPQFSVGATQGALFPRFTLQQVRFNDAELNIDTEVDSLTLAVKASCLLDPVLCVNEVAISGLHLNLPSLPASSDEPPSAPSEPLTNLSTPVPIKLGRLVLDDIHLNVLGHQLDWQHFATSATFQSNRLRIGQTDWQGVRVALAPAVETQTPAAPPAANEPAQDIVLPEVIIPLRVELSRFDLRDFTLAQETPIQIHHLGLKASAYQSQVSVDTLELDMPQVNAKLNTQITLSGDYPLSLALDATAKLAEAKGQTLTLNASGSVANLALKAQLAGRAEAQLNAKLQPLNSEFPFDVTIDTLKAQWPLVEKGEYFVEAPRIAAKGSLQGYQLELQSHLKGNAVPEVDVALQGEGNLQRISLNELKVHTLGGDIQGQASADWSALVKWQASLNLKQIQPGLQWLQAEGVVSGDVATSGQLTKQGGWQVELPTLAIHGMVRDYPLDINGTLSASDVSGNSDFKFSTPGLTLAHGPNKVTAQGQLDKTWRLGLSLDLPDLAKSVPDLTGKVIGDVTLLGPLKEPKVKLALDADRLAWQQEAKVKHVTLSGSVVPMPTPRADISLRVQGIEYQDQVVRTVNLVARGTQAQHELTLDVDSDLVSTQLAVTGGLLEKPAMIWDGRLERARIESQQGVWELNHATEIKANIDQQNATIAAHCWRQAGSSLCLDKPATVGASGEAQLSVNQFDFAQVKAFLPPETLLRGSVDADVWAKWSPDQPPQVKAKIRMPEGNVEQKLEQTLKLGWDKIELNAMLVKNRLQADWQVDVTDNGDVSGKLTIPNVIAEDKQMQGALKLTTFNIDFLAPLIGEYSEVKSNIETDVTFSGAMLHPQVNGRFSVSDMQVRGDIAPVEINAGTLAVNFNGYQATLDAGIETTDGKLNVTGDANWQQLDDWRVNAHVGAESLLVDLPPMVKMKVVPDLTLAMQPKLAKIDGSIALPWGRIVVEELPPSAISVSKDQMLVNADLQPISEQSSIPFNVETNVSIVIGNDFKLSAFGLEGGLVGRLQVSQKDQGPFVTGEVNIQDGQYRSFGQDLIIQEGKILMNGPVDQPYVSIKAIRNPDNTQDDVVAGVQVTGPADEPTVSIFSDPSMPQANALSYLLRGQDIDGETGGNAMTTTLIGLSLAKSGKVVGQIGEELGVQDLQLDTAGSGDDSQVTVSGYILPGLQVKYGVGIFNSVGEFTVRYRLMKDLYLEAVSGLDSAVDLLYRFEFN